MNRQIELAITNYIYEKIPEPEKHWSKFYFSQRSYSRWAAKEILEILHKNQDKSPIEMVENFMKTMEDFSCTDDKNWKDGFIFSVAHDVASDILDILIAMQ